MEQIELLYHNVLIENPFYKGKKSSIHLDETTEKKIQEEIFLKELEKTRKVKVFKAGQACTKIKDADEVFIETNRLMSSPRVALNEKDYFIVRETDIIFIYKSEGLNLV